MKRKVFPININLSQGLFLDDKNTILAAFNNDTKKIFVKVPYTINDIELPANYNDYTIKQKTTDCFHLQMWTSQDEFETVK